MNKKDFYEKLNNLGEGSQIIICWDRGNGNLERKCCFKGFSEGKPLLYLPHGTLLDIDAFCGYNSISSVKEIE